MFPCATYDSVYLNHVIATCSPGRFPTSPCAKLCKQDVYIYNQTPIPVCLLLSSFLMKLKTNWEGGCMYVYTSCTCVVLFLHVTLRLHGVCIAPPPLHPLGPHPPVLGLAGSQLCIFTPVSRVLACITAVRTWHQETGLNPETLTSRSSTRVTLPKQQG